MYSTFRFKVLFCLMRLERNNFDYWLIDIWPFVENSWFQIWFIKFWFIGRALLKSIMNSITTIQFCLLISVGSFVQNIDALKCWSANELTTDNLVTEVGGATDKSKPTSVTCDADTKVCKRTISGNNGSCYKSRCILV